MANYKILFKYLDKWMNNREENCYISDYLCRVNKVNIGIYGYGTLGKHLVHELQNSDISIEWIIDKNTRLANKNLIIHTPDEFSLLKKVDLVIIASGSAYEEIEFFLISKGCENIISLYEIIDDMSLKG